jgi:hypothetical protein
MSPRHAIFTLLVATACAHQAPPPPSPAPVCPPPERPSEDAGAHRRVVHHREPEAQPREFAEHTTSLDVDGDGRVDLVRSFPPIVISAETRAEFAGLPPAVVAHRLEDGRYAVDDEVTRTALRALCPVSPPPRTYETEGQATESERTQYLEALFIDGFCMRVWGAPLSDAEARVRANANASNAAFFPPADVDATLAALRAMPVPFELDTLDAQPIAVVSSLPYVAEPTAAPRAVSPQCATVNRANAAAAARAARLGAVRPGGPGRPLTLPSGDDPPFCLASAQGVWSIALGATTFVRGDEPSLHTNATLAWRSVTAGAASPTAHRLNFETREFSTDGFNLAGLYDYDNDGTPEVIVAHVEWVEEGRDGIAHTVFTVRDGAVREYAPAHAFEHIEDVIDADHDGRPDLVLPSPWRVEDTCGMDGIEHFGPRRLAHALPDGQFSTTDTVSRAWTLSQCRRYIDQGMPGPDVLDVACARLAGSSPEATVAALHARLPAGPQRGIPPVRTGLCLTFHELASMALVPLPFGP